jgi:serine/threonine-protein kinase
MADMSRPHIADFAGRRLGRYDALELIERTPLSVSYKASDSETGQIVVVTVLNSEQPMPAEARQRFRQECSLVARLNHPYILRLLAYYPDEELPLMVYEDVDGQLLSERLGKPWPYETALPLLEELADALDSAHRAGVVHRSFGPERIVMRTNETPVIMGFAVPRILGLDSQVTSDGMPLSQPEYLSPEQLRGQPADARSDLYSLAVLTYEMLGGEPPFRGNRDGLLRAHQGGSPRDLRSINSQVPAWVAAAVARGLEKDPGRRFQGVRQFAEALRRNEALATPAGQASSTAAPAQKWKPPPRAPSRARHSHRLPVILVAGGVAFALLTAAAATAFALTQDDGENGNGQVAEVEDSATGTPGSTSSTIEPAGLAVGDNATVQGTGDGLRLRSEPAGEQIGTLPDGTVVSIVGGPETAQDITWWQVETDLGNGWVAEGAEGATWLMEGTQ